MGSDFGAGSAMEDPSEETRCEYEGWTPRGMTGSGGDLGISFRE